MHAKKQENMAYTLGKKQATKTTCESYQINIEVESTISKILKNLYGGSTVHSNWPKK